MEQESPIKRVDVAIIGSGIAGSMLGAILARHGQETLIFEAGSHPRFAIGESMILESSEMMRALGELYDIPELAFFSSENFFDVIGTSHGVKRHFGFVHHVAGQTADPNHWIQAVIPKEPHGHELHLYRQDSDYYLLSCAIHYGATVWQKAPVVQIDFGEEGHLLTTADGRQVQAGYVVDASGFRSPIATQLDLHHRELQTHSRAIFTHMIDVGRYDDLAGVSTGQELPFPMAEGTLHHVFKGGWLWIIPFNNHERSTNPLVSVGLMLDPRIWPDRPEITAEEEFWDVISRFPSIAAQLEGSKAVRDWVRTPRLQYGATRVVGDRWALLGHAAGFIDPLFSKGLYSSLTAVALLAHLLLEADQSGDYSAAAFAPLEAVTQNYLATADRLVANSYTSFHHPALWRSTAVVWLLGAYTELVKLSSIRAITADRQAYFGEIQTLRLAGGGFPEFQEVCDSFFNRLEEIDPDSFKLRPEGESVTILKELQQPLRTLSWIPEPFIAILDGATSLPKNKLRLSLLSGKNGFMRTGRYRRHFFGEHSFLELATVFIREKITYSPAAIRSRIRKKRSGPTQIVNSR